MSPEGPSEPDPAETLARGWSGMIPFPDRRGYPVRLRSTGCVIGYCAIAIDQDRPSLTFVETLMPTPSGGPLELQPVRGRLHRMIYDGERRCLWTDATFVVRMDGIEPL